jgi:hypothetical protein
LAWNSRDVRITDPLFTGNTLIAKVTKPTSAIAPWWIIMVYGPQEDVDKISFL